MAAAKDDRKKKKKKKKAGKSKQAAMPPGGAGGRKGRKGRKAAGKKDDATLAVAAPPEAAFAPVPAVSPLAPAGFPAIPPVAGVAFAAVAAEVRYRGRTDVMLARLAPGTAIAGVFTRSATAAAPVLDGRAKLGRRATGGAAIIVNSGNANAFTGAGGREAVEAVTAAVADRLGVPQSRVFMSSTGVIGEPLPFERITARLDEAASALDPGAIRAAAGAIMTTDTYPKGAFAVCEIGGRPVTVAGIAKGSGMIAPDMATMLAYVFTDAAVDQTLLQRMLVAINATTFNAITVDSDTSTSDTLLLCATGRSGAAKITDARTRDAQAFKAALSEVMTDLAQQVVRDGEGASKFVTISVTGAASAADARKVAMSVANSPLVKTAIAGEDPNWGRVVMAVGKSGARADRDRLSIRFGDVQVAENGWVSPGYDEAEGARVMQADEIEIGIDLGLGSRSARVWTCDLTARYIEINADYRS